MVAEVGKRYAKLCAWAEENKRTLLVRIFPNAAACLRSVRALAAETHEKLD